MSGALLRTAPGAGASRATLRAAMVEAAKSAALDAPTLSGRFAALGLLSTLVRSADPHPARRTALALTGAPLRAVDLLRVELELVEDELAVEKEEKP